MLDEKWENAKEGDGQVVLLSGMAGVGKSRLLHEWLLRLLLWDKYGNNTAHRANVLYNRPHHQ